MTREQIVSKYLKPQIQLYNMQNWQMVRYHANQKEESKCKLTEMRQMVSLYPSYSHKD